MVRLLNTADRAYLAAGAMLYVAFISPPVLRLLESRMTTHMTVLLPGLALAGYLCGVRLRTLVAPVSQRWNAGGIPGLIAALFTAAFWMLPRALDLYFRLIAVRIRAQMQYRVSFIMDTLGAAFTTFVEFTALYLVFTRFGSIGGWTIGEVAFLYGLVETAFGTMDMLFSGFDPGFFSAQIQRGVFDQFLLRPLGLPLQMFTAEFVVRRLGRMLNGAAIFVLALSLSPDGDAEIHLTSREGQLRRITATSAAA